MTYYRFPKVCVSHLYRMLGTEVEACVYSEVEPVFRKLKRCLDSSHKVIQEANGILCGISHPSVCTEVLLSSQGSTYITGVTEVYRVAKRIEGGMKSLNLEDEALKDILRNIEFGWHNLQAFLSLSPSVLQKLPSTSTLDYLLDDLEYSSADCQHGNCGVCLLKVPSNTEAATETVVSYQGCLYHTSCANFWLNCVENSLPEPSSLLWENNVVLKESDPVELPV